MILIIILTLIIEMSSIVIFKDKDKTQLDDKVKDIIITNKIKLILIMLTTSTTEILTTIHIL
jgi:hypothetical protein